ncbi:MAG TPA: hypothetical protein VM869_05065 [Enhygromyxa sp.]|nr:hypothetical protein [Enhygromyxa sp.]
MSEVWYVFDPKHPRRTEQIIARLQVEDSTLLVERGVCLREWELVERRALASPRAARSALEARLADASARGLAIETDDVSVIGRLSARHPELEGLLAAVQLDSPDGRELLQVYADFLQAEGDPRGMLASLQLRNLDARPWFAEHMTWCFGRFTPLVQRSNKDQGKLISARWFGGWITHLWLYVASGRFADAPAPELSDVLRLPACASLRRLMAPSQRLPDAPELSCRASLRWLWTAGFSTSALTLGELPRLEHLSLSRCPRSLDVRAPNLRSLGFTDAGLPAIAELLDSGSVGPLERLECELPREDVDTAELRALLRHGALASLRAISLSRRQRRYYESKLPLRESVLELLCADPLLLRLELRDFTGLTLQGEQRERLLAAFASAPGRTVA